MAGNGNGALSAWQELVRDSGARPGNRLWNARYLFEGVPLEGRTVLEIGCGSGWHSLYAAACGAEKVVGLEPEGDGSTAGSTEGFSQRAATLGLTNVELVHATLQEFDGGGGAWDVVLSNASINHLDEAACVSLRVDAGARAVYRALFDKLASMMRPGGAFIASDSAPDNLFRRIGMRNPFAPSVEWEKHQHPRVWAELLAESGFHSPRIRWSTLNTLRTPGRVVLGNRVGAYCCESTFTLTMRYGGR